MVKGVTNSKSVLFFAGGVILLAVIVAASLGDQYIPGEQTDDEASSSEVASAQSASESSEASFEEADYEEDAGYDAYEDYAGEEDLIDDTAGFDTEPSGGFTDVADSDGGDESFEEYDEYVEESPSSPTPRTAPAAERQPATPPRRPSSDGLSVAEMKERLKKPPVVDNDEG